MFQKIINKIIGSNQNNPLAIQCLWNSDYDYIGLTIELIFKENKTYTTKEIVELEYKNFDSTKAMAIEAQRIANKYANEYKIELYFPSPDEWLRDCPNWWEHKSSPKCEDCKTPIIPTDSEYLPKEVCYPCHLKRESNKQIVNAEPCDDGVKMYLSKDDNFESIGYCTKFDSFTIAPFIKHRVKQNLKNGITVITLEKPDILELHDNLKNLLNQKFEDYIEPTLDENRKKFITTKKVEYNGIQYELAERFNREHEEILNLLDCLKINLHALQGDYVYEIYFKNGFTYRDDSILRFVNYVNKGRTKTEYIKEHYKKILTEIEIIEVLQKLQRFDCIEITKDEVIMTKIGIKII